MYTLSTNAERLIAYNFDADSFIAVAEGGRLDFPQGFAVWSATSFLISTHSNEILLVGTEGETSTFVTISDPNTDAGNLLLIPDQRAVAMSLKGSLTSRIVLFSMDVFESKGAMTLDDIIGNIDVPATAQGTNYMTIGENDNEILFTNWFTDRGSDRVLRWCLPNTDCDPSVSTPLP